MVQQVPGNEEGQSGYAQNGQPGDGCLQPGDEYLQGYGRPQGYGRLQGYGRPQGYGYLQPGYGYAQPGADGGQGAARPGPDWFVGRQGGQQPAPPDLGAHPRTHLGTHSEADGESTVGDGKVPLSQERRARKGSGGLGFWLAVLVVATFLFQGGLTILMSEGLYESSGGLYTDLGLLVLVLLALVGSWWEAHGTASRRFTVGDRPVPLSQERLTCRERGGAIFWIVAFFGASVLYWGAVVVISVALGNGFTGAVLTEDLTSAGTLPELFAGLFALLFGLLMLWSVAVMMPGHAVLDATGLHLHGGRRTRDVPWPRSRTGLFVRMVAGSRGTTATAQVHVLASDGQVVAVPGLLWSGASSPSLEAMAVASCSRIWDWAVARGYTQETHEYVPLVTQPLLQEQREEQEQRFGLTGAAGQQPLRSTEWPPGTGARRPRVGTVVLIVWCALSYLYHFIHNLVNFIYHPGP